MNAKICALAASIGMVALSSSAASAPRDSEIIVLRYQAPAACPDAASFLRLVREKSPPSPRTTFGLDGETAPGAASRAATATIVETAAGEFEGTLAFDGAREHSVPRTISGRPCEEVASALALMVGLTVDESPRDLFAEKQLPAVENTRVETRAASDHAMAATDLDENRPAPPSPPSPRLAAPIALGVEAIAQGGMAPKIALGGEAFISFGELLAPLELRVAAGYVSAGSSTVALPAGSTGTLAAHFDSAMAQAEICGFRLPVTRRAALASCAGLLGTITFAGGSPTLDITPSDRTDARLYGELGPTLQWDWGDGWSVELRGHLLAALYGRSDTYVFENPTPELARIEAYTVPLLSGSAGLGIVRRIP